MRVRYISRGAVPPLSPQTLIQHLQCITILLFVFYSFNANFIEFKGRPSFFVIHCRNKTRRAVKNYSSTFIMFALRTRHLFFFFFFFLLVFLLFLTDTSTFLGFRANKKLGYRENWDCGGAEHAHRVRWVNDTKSTALCINTKANKPSNFFKLT